MQNPLARPSRGSVTASAAMNGRIAPASADPDRDRRWLIAITAVPATNGAPGQGGTGPNGSSGAARSYPALDQRPRAGERPRRASADGPRPATFGPDRAPVHRPATSPLHQEPTVRPDARVATPVRDHGDDDDVTPVRLDPGWVYVGLPKHEGGLLGELLRTGEIGYELSLDPRTPIVIGVYPMRPIPRS